MIPFTDTAGRPRCSARSSGRLVRGLCRLHRIDQPFSMAFLLFHVVCHKPRRIVIEARRDAAPHLSDLIDHRVTLFLRHRPLRVVPSLEPIRSVESHRSTISGSTHDAPRYQMPCAPHGKSSGSWFRHTRGVGMTLGAIQVSPGTRGWVAPSAPHTLNLKEVGLA